MGNISTNNIINYNDDNITINMHALSEYKNDKSICDKFKINTNIKKFIYLLYFKFNNNQYIKIGTSKNIYTRLKNIQKDLHIFDKKCNINIIWCNKNTGDICYEDVIKILYNKKYKKLKDIEIDYLKSYIKEHNIKIKKNKPLISGYTEMYNIQDNDILYCIKTYKIYMELTNKSDSISEKIKNNIKRFIFKQQ